MLEKLDLSFNAVRELGSGLEGCKAMKRVDLCRNLVGGVEGWVFGGWVVCLC